MKITSKTSIDRNVECLVRAFWLKKSAKKRVISSILTIPIMWFAFACFARFNVVRTVIMGTGFSIVYGAYLVYAYGVGHRRKIKKAILETLDGREYPAEIEYVIDSEGVSAKTEIAEVKIPWTSINRIDRYRDYIEFQAYGSTLWIERDICPSVEELMLLKASSQSVADDG